MRRPYAKDDAQEIIALFEDTLRELLDARDRADALTNGIEGYFARCHRDRVRGIMKEMPVERLREKQKGVPVKLLTEAGFADAAALDGVPAVTLKGLRGVGPKTANSILTAMRLLKLEDVFPQLCDGLTLKRDDAEDVTFVRNLYACRAASDVLAEADSLLNRYADRLRQDIARVERYQGTLQWLLAGSGGQTDAADAYYELCSFEEQGFIDKARELSERLAEKAGMSTDAAWALYESAPDALKDVLSGIGHTTCLAARDKKSGEKT